MTKALKENDVLNAKSEGQHEQGDNTEEKAETVNLEAIKKDLEDTSDPSGRTVLQEVPKPFTTAVDSTNPLSPIKQTAETIKKVIYPPDFTQVNEFTPLVFENLESKPMYKDDSHR